jgi:hypothetical protein
LILVWHEYEYGHDLRSVELDFFMALDCKTFKSCTSNERATDSICHDADAVATLHFIGLPLPFSKGRRKELASASYSRDDTGAEQADAVAYQLPAHPYR